MKDERVSLPVVAGWLLPWLLVFPLAAAGGTSSPPPQAGTTATPTFDIPHRPIASREQLQAYQRATPENASPLSLLTPGGRRRFLGSLVFGRRGLAGFSTADLEFDLTRAQAYAVLQLFGEQDYALQLDSRTTQRPASRTGETPALEPRFDRLFSDVSPMHEAAAQKAAIEHDYPQLGPFQTEARLRSLATNDVELLFRAASLAYYDAHRPAYLTDMRADFAELARRHRVDRPHVSALYDALVRAGQPAAASTLVDRYPSIDRRPPPAMRSAPGVLDGEPSVWRASPGKRELTRRRFALDAPAQLVVLGSAGCHFSVSAADAIESDPTLRDLFRRYAHWIAPADDLPGFDAVQAWNRAHPAQPLAIAHADAEFPMFGRATPTFYFLRAGQVVATVVGWPDGGRRAALLNGFKEIGLAH